MLGLIPSAISAKGSSTYTFIPQTNSTLDYTFIVYINTHRHKQIIGTTILMKKKSLEGCYECKLLKNGVITDM